MDKILSQKILLCPQTTATEGYYIDLNLDPIRFIIMKRRLMFYWSILQKDSSQLVKQVFKIQAQLPVKDDLTMQIKDDLQKCQIFLSEDDITSLSKESFRSLVNSRVRDLSVSYLNALKQKHTKTQSIEIGGEMQGYLQSEILTTSQKQILFNLRMRTTDFKINYKNKYKNDMSCRFCTSAEIETYFHALKCPILVCDPSVRKEAYQIHPNDIYGTLKEQFKAVHVWEKIFKRIKTINITVNS